MHAFLKERILLKTDTSANSHALFTVQIPAWSGLGCAVARNWELRTNLPKEQQGLKSESGASLHHGELESGPGTRN